MKTHTYRNITDSGPDLNLTTLKKMEKGKHRMERKRKSEARTIIIIIIFFKKKGPSSIKLCLVLLSKLFFFSVITLSNKEFMNIR